MAPARPTVDSHRIGRQGLVKDLNVRAVYEWLASHGPASRADLARDLGLSQASIGRIVDGLLQAGLLREGQRITSGIGRPQTLIHQQESAAVVAGLSLRSRYLRIHLANLAGQVLGRKQVLRANESPQALAQQLAEELEHLHAKHVPESPLAAIAIGISGVWNDLEQRVYAAPNLQLLEAEDALSLFKAALADLAPKAAVILDNDINFAALGERSHGIARNINDFFYLSLGSGVGGAAVVKGIVQRGVSGFAGELGYLPVYADNRLAPLEEFVARHRLEELVRSVGISIEHEDVFETLESHEAEAIKIAEYVSEVLGQALVSVVTTLNPRLIVLGGGVGRHGTKWTTRIRACLAHFVPTVPDIAPTAIEPEASLLGAVEFARVQAREVLLSQEG